MVLCYCFNFSIGRRYQKFQVIGGRFGSLSMAAFILRTCTLAPLVECNMILNLNLEDHTGLTCGKFDGKYPWGNGEVNQW